MCTESANPNFRTKSARSSLSSTQCQLSIALLTLTLTQDEVPCYGALYELLDMKKKLNGMVTKQGKLEKQIRDKLAALNDGAQKQA